MLEKLGWITLLVINTVYLTARNAILWAVFKNPVVKLYKQIKKWVIKKVIYFVFA